MNQLNNNTYAQHMQEFSELTNYLRELLQVDTLSYEMYSTIRMMQLGTINTNTPQDTNAQYFSICSYKDIKACFILESFQIKQILKEKEFNTEYEKCTYIAQIALSSMNELLARKRNKEIQNQALDELARKEGIIPLSESQNN